MGIGVSMARSRFVLSIGFESIEGVALCKTRRLDQNEDSPSLILVFVCCFGYWADSWAIVVVKM